MSQKNFCAKIVGLMCFIHVMHISSGEDNWSYERDSDHGPSYWYKQSPNCNGSRQSPIDITTITLNSSLTPFLFNNYDVIPSKIVATDNGHSVTVTVPNDVLTIRDGGLESQYTFTQFHFHWGSNDSYGSEHLDHNKAYPAELHFVHWNSGKYSSPDESLKYPDGLAVLGVLVDVVHEDDPRINQDLDMLTESFHSIEYINNWTNVAPFKLINLFPPERDYYRYHGSLTTPGCNEIVIWTLFKHPIYLSSAQLSRFRHFHSPEDPHEYIEYSNRPVQPINDRVVYYSGPFQTIYTTPAVKPGQYDFVDPGTCAKKLITMNIKTWAKNHLYKPVNVTNSNTLLKNFLLRNTGTALTIRPKTPETNPIKLSGGSVDFTYVLLEIFILWGIDHNDGSQYSINNEYAAFEVQLLFWNSQKYSSFEQAQPQEDGLVMLSVLGKINDKSSSQFIKSIYDRINSIKNPGSEVEFPNLTLSTILPADPRYFSFYAPLTFPFCSNKVRRIVLSTPIYIAQVQLQAFRQLVLTQKYQFVSASLPESAVSNVIGHYNMQPGIHGEWKTAALTIAMLCIAYLIQILFYFI